ncbi:MAG: capsular biosynthesis protein CpsE [Deltaproteobacteria bacterium]|nr:MAG: capsular biosynthesis protein CpsE [Deltaproteobacteria bacterium]
MLRFFRQYFPIRNVIFFVFEGIAIFGTFLISSVLLTVSGSYFFDFMLVLRIILISLLFVACLYYNDLYDFDKKKKFREIFIKLIQSIGFLSIITALIFYIFPLPLIDVRIFLISILVLFFFIIFWRTLYIYLLEHGIFNEKVVIVGSSDLSVDIFKEITKTLDCGYKVKAVFPDSGDNNIDKFGKAKIKFYYNLKNLYKTASSAGTKKIVVAMKEQRGSFPIKELIQCRSAGLEIINGYTFYEQLTGKILVEKINPSWLIFSDGFHKSLMKDFMKRVIDIFSSVILLIISSPLIIITALMVKLGSKGPVIFAQDRVGKNKKEFMMYKFRSMVNNAEKITGPVWAEEEDPRITKVGRIIRKYRIDELPQLWNVLKGDMSLVGPRPERKFFTDDLENEIPFYSQRFLVKPGLTGWAQVSFDYAATVEDSLEKLNYEMFYIKNSTILMDIVIILRTVKIVLFGRGSR